MTSTTPNGFMIGQLTTELRGVSKCPRTLRHPVGKSLMCHPVEGSMATASESALQNGFEKSYQLCAICRAPDLKADTYFESQIVKRGGRT